MERLRHNGSTSSGSNCPHNQHFDEERGRCVDNEMEKKHDDCSQLDVDLNRCIPETVDGAENPNSRSKSSPNLTFQTHKKRGEIKKI